MDKRLERRSLVFLKLGGSLITDKARPHTLRPEVLSRVVAEISAALRDDPGLHMVLGHGSGSFGHVPAKQYGTRQGVLTSQQWQGFVEVWRQAFALNKLVMEAIGRAGVQAIAFPPSAGVTARDGRPISWDLAPLQAALRAGLLPVVYGDVVFDTVRGGTILSTEDLFAYLTEQLSPERILLAGQEPGVWADYPACTRLVAEITPANLTAVAPALSGSAATDVTGGMAGKVQQSLELVKTHPSLQVLIFSGEKPGAIQQALRGETVGTRVNKRW